MTKLHNKITHIFPSILYKIQSGLVVPFMPFTEWRSRSAWIEVGTPGWSRKTAYLPVVMVDSEVGYEKKQVVSFACKQPVLAYQDCNLITASVQLGDSSSSVAW